MYGTCIYNAESTKVQKVMPSHMAVGFCLKLRRPVGLELFPGLHLGLNQPNLNNPVSVSYSGDLGIVGGAMRANLDTIIGASEAEVTVSCCNNGVMSTSTCGNIDSQTYVPCVCGENRTSKCILALKSFS